MTTKQTPNSLFSPDGSYYACLADGAGNLLTTTTSATGGTKQTPNSLYAPDGSYYMTLTDGNGNLV